MNFVELKNNLTETQMKIIKDTEGFIRIIAGAGTGKTNTLTYRYLYLIDSIGIEPSEILVMTYTNKAKDEMLSRIKMLSKNPINNHNIATIHSFCANFLKQNIFALHFHPNFILNDEEDLTERLKQIRKELSNKNKNLTEKIKLSDMKNSLYLFKKNNTSYYINYLTNADTSLDDYEFEKNEEFIKELLKYQKINQNLYFDDLIFFTIHILKTNDTIREKTQKQYSYIFVDEFQDTTESQFEILKILSQFHKNLFVVGDPDQSIYSFNNASVKIFLDFDKNFENVKTYYVQENFRSNKEIIDVANALIQNNTQRLDTKLIATKPYINYKPTVYTLPNLQKENNKVIELIRSLIDKFKCNYNDIAILYRANKVSKNIEPDFIKNKIPYRILRGTSFFQRIEIKLLISYMNLAIHEDDTSFLYIVKNNPFGVGNKKLELLKNYSVSNNITLYKALKQLNATPTFNNEKLNKFIKFIYALESLIDNPNTAIKDAIYFAYEKSGYKNKLEDINDEDRITNVQAFISLGNDTDEENHSKENEDKVDIKTFLQRLLSYQEYYNETKNKNSVNLCTSHSAKGLEFEHVIVYNFIDSYYPSSHSFTQEQLEEERRLFYVTITRAKKTIDFTLNSNIPINEINYEISPYASEIYEYVNFVPKINLLFQISNNKISESDENNFDEGDVVYNEIFGYGTVLFKYSDNSIVQFANTSTPRRVKNSKLIKRSAENE